MAKKKFVEKRRKEAQMEIRDSISPRSKANEVVDIVRGWGGEVEVHNSDDGSGYYGLMFSYDPPSDETWLVVRNPLGGPELELTITYGFGIGFAAGYWLYWKVTPAIVLTVIAAIGGFALAKAWKHMPKNF